MKEVTSIVCSGPAYRNCTNVVDVEHAFVPPAARINGKGPMTVARLVAVAVCDECARHLQRKGVKLYPLCDAVAVVEEREQEAKPTASLGELLMTSSLFKASQRASAQCARQAEAVRRRANVAQAARLCAAAQRTTVAA
jgi:predicted GNAT family acetyltransferase